MYGTGCARSDFTTYLPVPWRGWGPLVRSKQAVFRVLDFERIGVLGCLATIVEEARNIRTGSNSAHGSSAALCARHAEIRPLFLVFWCAKDEPKARFQSLGIWWCWGRMRHKLAQSFDHGRLFNVAFGSSQTDDWLPRYGHLKFRGGVVLQY